LFYLNCADGFTLYRQLPHCAKAGQSRCVMPLLTKRSGI